MPPTPGPATGKAAMNATARSSIAQTPVAAAKGGATPRNSVIGAKPGQAPTEEKPSATSRIPGKAGTKPGAPPATAGKPPGKGDPKA